MISERQIKGKPNQSPYCMFTIQAECFDFAGFGFGFKIFMRGGFGNLLDLIDNHKQMASQK